MNAPPAPRSRLSSALARTIARLETRNVRGRYASSAQPVVNVAPYRKLNRRGQLNKEVNYKDSTSNNYALDTTGTIRLPFEVASGTAVTERTGKKIILKSLQVRGFLVVGLTAQYNDVAILVVFDKRPTGSLPAITDILVSADSFAMNNDSNSGRFTILKRHDLSLVGNGAGNNYTSNTMVSADFFVDLKNRSSVYKALGTGAIGDIEEGAIYIIAVGNNVAGTGACTGYLNCRLRYYDV